MVEDYEDYFANINSVFGTVVKIENVQLEFNKLDEKYYLQCHVDEKDFVDCYKQFAVLKSYLPDDIVVEVQHDILKVHCAECASHYKFGKFLLTDRILDMLLEKYEKNITD